MDTATAPKFVFIVPYRDREPHREFFNTYIYKIMEDVPSDEWTFFLSIKTTNALLTAAQ